MLEVEFVHRHAVGCTLLVQHLYDNLVGIHQGRVNIRIASICSVFHVGEEAWSKIAVILV
jgi:hypothetical protein